MKETLVGVEDEIVSRVGETIRAFFDGQVRAGEHHLTTATPPQRGQRAPEFALADTMGELVTLSELLRAGPAVLLFLRGHW